MARDLTREARQPSRNGVDVTAIVDDVLDREDSPAAQQAAPERADEPHPDEVMAVRRDKLLSRIAVNMVLSAKILDPLTRILLARFLALASLAAAAGIVVYTISRTEGWERVATCGLFVVLASWLIRKGQQ